jgi:phosphoglycolate phosphatase
MRPLAIWDVDGTLVDSRTAIHEAMTFAYAQNGCAPPSFDDIRHVVGLALRDAFAVLFPDLPAEARARFEAAYVNAFRARREDGEGREPLYPGAGDMLQRLRADGWRLGVATGKSRRGLDRFLASHDLSGMFDTHLCAEDGPGKPHPFMIDRQLSLLAAPRGSAVMIGDAVHDMRMAMAAGVRGVGVSWGFGTADEILLAGAAEVHDGFDTLGAALQKWRQGVRGKVGERRR